MDDSVKYHSCQLGQEVQYSYLLYAVSVNEFRALANVNDGLTPCRRRILFTSFEDKIFHDKRFSKSSSVVGSVIKSYHPHGDGPIYETLVRMTQKFNIRYPLTEGQGNFGSLDGDSPAAMRYTGVKLSYFSKFFYEDLAYDTVPTVANYDESKQEPTVLPVMFPNIIINGATGIAVGMSTNIPPHNLEEILKGWIHFIRNPNATVEELMEFIQGPDFPCGGMIINKNSLKEIYETGNGPVTIRGTYKEFEDHILITSIPYKINKATLLQQISDTIKRFAIKGIEKIWDESNTKEIRIVIKKNALCCVDFLMNTLFKYTMLQINFHCNCIVLQNGKPKKVGLLDIFHQFTNFRIDIIRKRYIYLLKKTRINQENTFAILVVLDNLDDIIKIIRDSQDKKDAIEQLTKRTWACYKIKNYVNSDFLEYIDLENYQFSVAQCEYILGMRLQQLTRMEYAEIVEQMLKNYENINNYLEIINNEDIIKDKIIEETNDILGQLDKIDNYKRKTGLSEVGSSGILQAPDEDVLIIVDKENYVKRVPLIQYRTQHRGGIGKSAVETQLKMAYVANNRDTIFFITKRSDGEIQEGEELNYCFAYPIWAYSIAEFIGNKAKGQHINSIVNDGHSHEIQSIFMRNRIGSDFNKYFFFVTKNGIGRKNAVHTFDKIRKTGKLVMKMKKSDNISDVFPVKEDDFIIIVTKKGYAIVFDNQDVRCFNSNYAVGVRCIRLKKGDEVIKAGAVDPKKMLLTITSNGYGKITNLSEYRQIKRGGMGVLCCKLQKNDSIIGAYLCNGDEEVVLGTHHGNIFKTSCKEISHSHRHTKGVAVCKLKEKGDFVKFANIIDNEIVSEEIDDE